MLMPVLLFVTAFVPAPQAGKAAPPDFSGTWALDLKQSNFGSSAAPVKRTDTITHTGKTIKDHGTATLADGDHATDIVFDLGGAETKTQAISGETRVTAA